MKPPEETEQERLIRLGEMTPFGSTVQFKALTSKKPSQPHPLTDFEKFMAQKTEDDMTRRKKVVPRKTTPVKVKTESVKPKNYQSSSQEFTIECKKQRRSKKQKPDATLARPEQNKLNASKVTKATKCAERTTSTSSDDEPYFDYKSVRSESASFPKAHKRKKTKRDWRPNWGRDADLSDYQDVEESDEDYTPGINDLSDDGKTIVQNVPHF